VEAYRGSRGIAPLIFNLGTSWRWVTNFTPWSLYLRESTAISFEEVAEWIPNPVWTFWGKENVFACARIRTPYLAARSRVTIPTAGVRMRSGLECPKYPYSDFIRGV